MHELEQLLGDPKLPLLIAGLSIAAFGIVTIIRAEYRYRNFKKETDLFLNTQKSGIVTDPFEKVRTFALKSAKPPDSVK